QEEIAGAAEIELHFRAPLGFSRRVASSTVTFSLSASVFLQHPQLHQLVDIFPPAPLLLPGGYRARFRRYQWVGTGCQWGRGRWLTARTRHGTQTSISGTIAQ